MVKILSILVAFLGNMNFKGTKKKVSRKEERSILFFFLIEFGWYYVKVEQYTYSVYELKAE